MDHAAHFDSAETQAHAARLGMWVFLGSEVLLFSGLFALYAACRTAHPEGFREGIADSTRVLGSINTAVLLVSSTLAALSVNQLRRGNARQSERLLLGTVFLGAVFLAIKFTEYAVHFGEGIYPGGASQFFATHTTPGLSLFWTLYFVSTGLHAIHVTVGMLILSLTARSVHRGRLTPERVHPLANAVIYWHLIDLIWIFLWPLYYLA